MDAAETATIDTSLLGPLSASPDEAAEPPRPAAPQRRIDPLWRGVHGRLSGRRASVCLFVGLRPLDAEPGDWLIGECFAARWREASRRLADVVIDATCPACSVGDLWEMFPDRVLRFRPDVVFILLDDRDAACGLEELPRYERRLESVITGVRSSGGLPVLIPCFQPADDAEIVRLVFQEAMSGIAKEREVPVCEGWESFRTGADELSRQLCDQVLFLDL